MNAGTRGGDAAVMGASALILAAPALPARPWPRHVLSQQGWRAMAELLPAEPGLELVALWADAGLVHALFVDDEPLLACAPVEAGLYAALSPHRPAAAAFERAVYDLWGHRAAGGTDARPLLDHGRWPVLHPMLPRPVPNAAPPDPPRPLPVDGAGLHHLPLGPVRAGPAEPVRLCLTARGERVVRLQAMPGHAHKGTLALMRGKPVHAAARLAARLAGDATVAHSLAFARAAEAALGIEAPPRAVALRAVMAELERVANHLGVVAAVCEAAGAGRPHARFLRRREAVLRACEAAFGHRLMMDRVVPGGVAHDLDSAGAAALLRALDAMEADLPALVGLYDGHPGLAGRVRGVGVTRRDAVARHAPGGPVGRAAGRAGDARHTPGYAPYDRMRLRVPVLAAGDVDARVRVRLAEAGESLGVLRRLLDAPPPGEAARGLPGGGGEGLGVAEAPRGDAWHWLRLEAGTVAAAFAADPGWRQWPLLDEAARGCDADEVPLVLESFDPSWSGVDL